MRYKF